MNSDGTDPVGSDGKTLSARIEDMLFAERPKAEEEERAHA
jgi:hypothetical protein